MNAQTRKYDVAVVYRIYPKMSKPALGLPFSDDKERMAEVCLQSFRRSLGALRAKIGPFWMAVRPAMPKRTLNSFTLPKTNYFYLPDRPGAFDKMQQVA